MPDTAPKATPVNPPDEKPKGGRKQQQSTDRTKPSSAKKPVGRPPELEKRLIEAFTMVGGGVAAMGMINPLLVGDGQIIADNAEVLGKAWAALAKENKHVKAFLDRALEGGAWGGVIFATGSVAFAIAANHGIGMDFPNFAPDTNGAPEPAPQPSPPPATGMPQGPRPASTGPSI